MLDRRHALKLRPDGSADGNQGLAGRVGNQMKVKVITTHEGVSPAGPTDWEFGEEGCLGFRVDGFGKRAVEPREWRLLAP